MTEQMRRSGETVSENKVAKIMRKLGIAARKKRRFKKTTDSKHTKRIAPNLLERNFTAEAPNQVWVTDVTAVWAQPGWAYLAAILDLFSRRVVGWAMSEHNDTTPALAALNKATRLRNPPPDLVHHSDRGSPYGSDKYIKGLKEAGIIPSMSRQGDCWDNAPSESFFSTYEHECRGQYTFSTFAHAQAVTGEYIEGSTTLCDCTRQSDMSALLNLKLFPR